MPNLYCYEEIKDVYPQPLRPSIDDLIKECEDIIENPKKSDAEPSITFED